MLIKEIKFNLFLLWIVIITIPERIKNSNGENTNGNKRKILKIIT